MKVEAAHGQAYFYPDVVVTCSEADRASPMVKREPLFIAEVLSPGTAAYDRGEKFAHYRRIPSLQEVAFIDVDSRRMAPRQREPLNRRPADGQRRSRPTSSSTVRHSVRA